MIMHLRSVLTAIGAAMALGACADQPDAIAPTAAPRFSQSANQNLRSGAVYTMTDEVVNRVVERPAALQPSLPRHPPRQMLRDRTAGVGQQPEPRRRAALTASESDT